MANRKKLLEILSEVMTYLHHAYSFTMYKLAVYMKENACSPSPICVDRPSWLIPASSVKNEDTLSMLKQLDCS